MSSDLPPGWISAPLEQIALLNPRHLRTLDASMLVSFVRMAAISDSKPQFDFLEERRLEEVRQGFTHFADGDVLFAKITPCMENGKGAVAQGLRNGIGCGTTELHIVRPLAGINPFYIYHFLSQLAIRQEAKENFTGTAGQARVPAQFVQQLSIPTAPLAEQHRIVARLEELLAKLNGSQTRLAKIPVLLKRFRQSILAAACSGHLTADWRRDNPAIEGADTLVRDAHFQMQEGNESLPHLPHKWKWVPLGNYAQCSRGRFSVRPRNDPSYFGGKYPFIQIGNLPPNGGWIESHTQTLNARGFAVSKEFPKGTVVIAIVGATIGNTGILAYDMCFTDSLVGIQTETQAGNRYVELFLRHNKHEIRHASYSSGGQPNIKLEFLNPYPLALPPLAEQAEIVRRVDSFFDLADQIEVRNATAKAHVDKLTQSILAKAFRGELVPQDPNDEPASVLLERIKAQSVRSVAGRRDAGERKS